MKSHTQEDSHYRNVHKQQFDIEVSHIISEIEERIKWLKAKESYHLVADTIASMLTPQLSPLIITNDFKIFLSDYNQEILLTPLSKAIYILFLKHSSGILFHDLPLYRDELTYIYRLFSARENLTEMQESIRKLTDPSNNSIHEKCSRIKQAFLQHLTPDLAKHYYIRSAPLEPKRIHLSYSLITLPKTLNTILF